MALFISLVVFGLILSIYGFIQLFVINNPMGVFTIILGIVLFVLADSQDKKQKQQELLAAEQAKRNNQLQDINEKHKNLIALYEEKIKLLESRLSEYENSTHHTPAADNPPGKTVPVPQKPKMTPPKDYDLFCSILTNSSGEACYLKYQKEDRVCFIDPSMFDKISDCGGKMVKFVSEPDNPHDSGAVAILYEGTKIGYVYRGNVQDMLNDFIRRNELYGGYLNKISPEDRTATFKVGFYKPISSRPQKEFPLVKTGKKDWMGYPRSENLSGCSVNDPVEIKYEPDSDAFVVYTEEGFEIGELGNAFSDIADYSENDYVGIISKIDDSDIDKTKLTISVIL